MSLRAVLALLLMLVLRLPAQAEAPAAAEYKVKAAFLYNFTKFVTWPRTEDESAEISVCVLGHDPFGPILDATFQGKNVAGRSLRVRRHSELAQTGSCQLLFIAEAERSQVKRAIERLRSSNVLIVSEARAFGQPGGMVKLVIDSKRVRIEINVAAARAAGLAISSRLLDLAVLAGEVPGSASR